MDIAIREFKEDAMNAGVLIPDRALDDLNIVLEFDVFARAKVGRTDDR